MDSGLPDLDTSSSASSPTSRLETPFTFDRGFKLGTSPSDAVTSDGAVVPAVEDSTCQAASFLSFRMPSDDSLSPAAQAMPSLGNPVATHPLRDRRGSGDAAQPDDKIGMVRSDGRSTSLAPRPAFVLSSLPAIDSDVFNPRRQSAPLISQHYPGNPGPVHLQQPTVTFAPSFRFGAPPTPNEVYNNGDAFLGTPSAEQGPFEYPVNVETAEPDVLSPTVTHPAFLRSDDLVHISNGSIVLKEANDSCPSPPPSSRSITTGQIPVLPTTRRPSVVHSATVAEVPHSEDPEPDGQDAPLGRRLSNSRRRPSLLLARLQPAAIAPIPPSLLNGRRGSLPVSSLFPTAGNGFAATPATGTFPARPGPPQSWTPGAGSNPNIVGGSTISAAYLYNRRAEATPVSRIQTPPAVAPASPAPSSRGLFSSHSTVTEATRDQGSLSNTPPGVRRSSLPHHNDQPPPPTAALEAFRKTKADAEATEQAMVGQSTPRKNSQNSPRILQPSNTAGRSSTSALSSSSDSSGNDQDDKDDTIEQQSQVSRAAAAIRERRRSSRNSGLSRGSLPTIHADETPAALRRGNGSQGSSSGEEDIREEDPPVDVELADSFSNFAFPAQEQPASSPFKRNSLTRPTLETIQSDDSAATAT